MLDALDKDLVCRCLTKQSLLDQVGCLTEYRIPITHEYIGHQFARGHHFNPYTQKVEELTVRYAGPYFDPSKLTRQAMLCDQIASAQARTAAQGVEPLSDPIAILQG